MSSKSPAPKKRGRNVKPSRSLQQQLQSIDKNKLSTETTNSPIPPPTKVPKDISEAELVRSILSRPEIDSSTIDWSQIRITAKSDSSTITSKSNQPREKDINAGSTASIAPSIAHKCSPDSTVAISNDASGTNNYCVNLAEHHWAGKAWDRKSWNDRNIDSVLLSAVDPFDQPQLRPDQEKLLRQAKPSTPTLNLRHLERGEALRRLNQFVQQCKTQGRWIIRVITGKGILSENEPVLKPALLRWCNDHHPKTVARWAPEIDANGEYGGLLIQLSRQR